MVLSGLFSPASMRALKWGLMSSLLFWAIVYRLSTAAAELPQFVYVNF